MKRKKKQQQLITSSIYVAILSIGIHVVIVVGFAFSSSRLGTLTKWEEMKSNKKRAHERNETL